MHEITISGATGTGKTLYAEYLESAARRGGLNVSVSDHELFSSHNEFKKLIESIRAGHRLQKADLSVVVVNDNGSSLRVDFGGSVPYRLACILFSNK